MTHKARSCRSNSLMVGLLAITKFFGKDFLISEYKYLLYSIGPKAKVQVPPSCITTINTTNEPLLKSRMSIALSPVELTAEIVLNMQSIKGNFSIKEIIKAPKKAKKRIQPEKHM